MRLNPLACAAGATIPQMGGRAGFCEKARHPANLHHPLQGAPPWRAVRNARSLRFVVANGRDGRPASLFFSFIPSP
ncbi:MAG: hypothetical protein BGP06_13210 [Rhizobiales bacterium 65-9]|nr:MAG: hypothetical protein BGP06_13210 [Rhizobiales bacterium 65-9]